MNKWPQLDYLGWRETCSALHLYLQTRAENIEKDLYVCWVLDFLFNRGLDDPVGLYFKGGRSQNLDGLQKPADSTFSPRIALQPPWMVAFVIGWGGEMAGLGSEPDELAKKMAAERPFLDAAGKLFHSSSGSANWGCAPSNREMGECALLGRGGSP